MFIFVRKLWLDAPPIACLFLKKFSKSTSKSRRQILTDSKPKNTKPFSRPDDLIGFYTKGCGAFKNQLKRGDSGTASDQDELFILPAVKTRCWGFGSSSTQTVNQLPSELKKISVASTSDVPFQNKHFIIKQTIVIKISILLAQGFCFTVSSFNNICM